MASIAALVDDAVASRDTGLVATALLEAGAAADAAELTRALHDFARAIGDVVRRPSPPVEWLESWLDGWAAPDRCPEVILARAAIEAYGDVGTARPEWRQDEIAKLRLASRDPRSEVRAAAVDALLRLTEHHE
jgi:hypothetical protein